MSTARTTPRRRLAAAVLVALAVTAGTAVTAAPAGAAPAGAAAAAGQSPEQNAVAPFPVNAWVVGAGPTGFLSAQSGTRLTYRWTRYEDGATTMLPDSGYLTARRTDIVATGSGDGVFTLRDMGAGTDPLEIDIRPLGDGYSLAAYAGTRIVMKKANATGGTGLHIVGKPDGLLVDRTVTGLPADAEITGITLDSPESAVVRYTGTVDGVKRSRTAVLDIATHALLDEYETPDVPLSGIALSATHIAWVEKPANANAQVVVTRRGTTETVRHDLGTTANAAIQLVGDWVTYRQFATYGGGAWDPKFALYAHSLTTRKTVKLLEHTTSATPGPLGTQLVRGGTFDQGEGLYRIAPGTDGTSPAVTLVASTGEPTTLELVKPDVPDTIDLDRVTAPVPLQWTLSRKSGRVRVELVHTATGKTWKDDGSHFAGGVVGIRWDAMYGSNAAAVPAPNGAYTWRLTADPADGIGPGLERTGTFEVTRRTVPHDFNDNGTPDLLVREGAGRLSLYNTSQPLGAWSIGTPERLGTGGWNAYDRLLTPGDVAGSAHSDVLGRDKDGVLWLHQGTGHGLAPRTKIGGGWQVYDKLTGGSDLDGDGRADLLATDTTGVLRLYKGTGSATAPFKAPTTVGGGWDVYNQLTATGNIGGGPAGDLVARDTAGVLWLYLGKGDGTFAARTRIGGGWNTYSQLVGFGDADRDGHPDLLAGGATPYIYQGTGDWRAPFKPRTAAYSYADLYPYTVF
ncbi:FG-GAP repeat domain-containing protein [Streptomyces sp. NPDC058128]|uniref:FG-GAP repeat domain-containing protein n=1 Tax=Streptomyces sp. NPDC058128 TaxID=3346352 RepID=UPI0036EAB754